MPADIKKYSREKVVVNIYLYFLCSIFWTSEKYFRSSSGRESTNEYLRYLHDISCFK